MPALRGYFVTGTDTGVGKTCVMAALTAIWRGLGVKALPMKPIQTGAVREAGMLRSPDLDFCLGKCGLRLGGADYARASRYRFETPCSPHLAARMAGTAISIGDIRSDCEALALCQRGYSNLLEAGWNDISKGMLSAEPKIDDEVQMRVFWREWDRLMTQVPA